MSAVALSVMSSKGFAVFDYEILPKEISALLFSMLKLPITGASHYLDALCKDNKISEVAAVLQPKFGVVFSSDPTERFS